MHLDRWAWFISWSTYIKIEHCMEYALNVREAQLEKIDGAIA
jgi:hypothetical protein